MPPAVVAIHEGPNGRRRIVAVGEAARTMEARTPEDIQAIRPLKDGSIADYEIAEAMLSRERLTDVLSAPALPTVVAVLAAILLRKSLGN